MKPKVVTKCNKYSTESKTHRDEGQVVTETDVLQLAAQRSHMTAVSGDFLFQPIDPGAAGLIELREGGEESL